MKKSLLTLLVAILASTGLNAQTLTLSDTHGDPIPNESRIDIPASQVNTYIHVTNTSGSAVSARVTKYHDNLQPGDEIMLCWGGQCYPHPEMIVPPLDRDPVTIEAGATDEEFDITYFASGTEVSEYTVTFYYEENPDDTTTIYVNWHPDGISEINTTEGSLAAYPNPASDYVTIEVNTENTLNSEIVLFNVLGKEVYKQELTDNHETLQINTANWANGVYYYTLISNSQKITTQKLIINH